MFLTFRSFARQIKILIKEQENKNPHIDGDYIDIIQALNFYFVFLRLSCCRIECR